MSIDNTYLTENAYRLLMCHRIAKSLGMGKILLDLATHKAKWMLIKDEEVKSVFSTLDELEEYLDHALENRRSFFNGYGSMPREVKRRAAVIRERERCRKEGTPMTLASSLNKPANRRVSFYHQGKQVKWQTRNVTTAVR